MLRGGHVLFAAVPSKQQVHRAAAEEQGKRHPPPSAGSGSRFRPRGEYYSRQCTRHAYELQSVRVVGRVQGQEDSGGNHEAELRSNGGGGHAPLNRRGGGQPEDENEAQASQGSGDDPGQMGGLPQRGQTARKAPTPRRRHAVIHCNGVQRIHVPARKGAENDQQAGGTYNGENEGNHGRRSYTEPECGAVRT